jgi:hypothetical protein
MAGRHRRRSRIRASIARGGTGLATAAVGATSITTAVVTGTAPSIAPAVDLMAVITPANSTSQFFAGDVWYGMNYADPEVLARFGGVRVTVPFFAGPQGIARVINEQSATNPPRNVVFASGWAAGQAGQSFDSLTPNSEFLTAFRLDNDTNRAGGGFFTTYYPLAPLLGTSAAPTQDTLHMNVFDLAYVYNINSDAVTYPLNVVSLGNSLAAYVYDYGGEQTAMMPKIGLSSGTHYVVDENTGRIVDAYDIDPSDDPGAANGVRYAQDANGDWVVDDTDGSNPNTSPTALYITFVSGTWEGDTFVPDVVPLLRPLNLIPGGDIVANTLEPVVREIVDAGYKDNQPIPENPRITRPMGLLPVSETATMVKNLPGDVVKGIQNGAATAQADFADPSNFITKPIAEFKKLPLINTLQQPSTSSLFSANSANKVTPASAKSGSSSSSNDRPRPLKKIADTVTSTLKKLTGADKETKSDDG